jgi:hypothetical protein
MDSHQPMVLGPMTEGFNDPKLNDTVHTAREMMAWRLVMTDPSCILQRLEEASEWLQQDLSEEDFDKQLRAIYDLDVERSRIEDGYRARLGLPLIHHESESAT